MELIRNLLSDVWLIFGLSVVLYLIYGFSRFLVERAEERKKTEQQRLQMSITRLEHSIKKWDEYLEKLLDR